ncbi:MAG: hypothetical protein ACLPWF_00420 [Bryobacteraceae bacterium]
MKSKILWCAAILPLAANMVHAQAPAHPPDFTGIWGIYRGGPGSDPKFRPPAPTPPALKPEYDKPYQAKRAEEAEAAKRGEQLANPGAECIPYGVPTMMSIAIYPVEFIQTPKQVTIISEAFSEVRRVYLDRPQAKLDDVAPGFYGRSVGHWDGDTLVVDTIGIKPTVTLRGMPHSPQMHVTERIRMLSPDILHDQITIDDPVVLEKPYTYTTAYKRMPSDYEMVEFVCDNNREYVDANGIVRLKLHEH